MQKILGYMRKAVQDYNMIQPGDKIAVGVSGGKDSVALLVGLARLRRFLGVPYEVFAVTLDPQFGGIPGDYSALEVLCRELEIPWTLKLTQIGQVVFEQRRETNPCSLCAKMRRGALHDTAIELGCNKIALGHHADDAVETFVMNLFNEGRIGCFSPVTYLSRKDITMIRPLVYAPEWEITKAVRRNGLPVVKSSCPNDGFSTRQWTKEWILQMNREHPGLKDRLFGAMRRGNVDGWKE